MPSLAVNGGLCWACMACMAALAASLETVSWTKRLMWAICSSEKEGVSCLWGRAGVSLVCCGETLAFLRSSGPSEVMPASFKRLCSVARLPVTGRPLLWEISRSWDSDKACKTAEFNRRFPVYGGAVCERRRLALGGSWDWHWAAMDGIVLKLPGSKVFPQRK